MLSNVSKAAAMAAAAVGAVAMFAGVALAQSPHGDYDRLTTDACGGCHRAHSAVSEDLKTEASGTFGLCTGCHGSGSTNTNVLAGAGTGGALLNGGGFETMGGIAATSTHTVNELGGGNGEGTAWGGASSGTGVFGVLECTSCHNPHGTSNYRVLRDSNNGYPYDNAAAHRWVPDNPELLDWQDNQVLPTADEPADGTKYAAGLTTYYTGGMRYFCSTCHKSYLTRSGAYRTPSTTTEAGTPYLYPGTQDALDGEGDVARYRHTTSRTWTTARTQALRFGANSTAAGAVRGEFVCTTCHYAHGTTAAANAYAANVAPTNDSSLLFYPARGVCRECHQTTK